MMSVWACDGGWERVTGRGGWEDHYRTPRAYRVLADEPIERGPVDYLQKLDHDGERLEDLGEIDSGQRTGASPGTRAVTTGRPPRRTTISSPNWPSRTRQASSFGGTRRCRRAREGDADQELSQYLEQSDVILDYVSRNWL